MMRVRGNVRNGETAILPCVARTRARCPVASRGGMRACSVSDSLSCAVVLGMGAALSVLPLSKMSGCLLSLLLSAGSALMVHWQVALTMLTVLMLLLLLLLLPAVVSAMMMP